MHRKVPGWVLVLVVLVIAGIFIVPSVPGWVRARAVRREAISLLSVASSPEQLDDAAGYLGTVLRNQHGDWVAIRYRDSHSYPGSFSVSVARCSDGSWLQSDVHYCALLGGYRKQCETRRELESYAATQAEREQVRQDYALTDPDMLTLAHAEASPDLASMKADLAQLGFRPMSPP